MKVCLINPPNIFTKPDDYELYPNIFTLPYLGIGYITSYLKQHKIHVEQYDCPLQDLSVNDICRLVSKEKFDIIGISTFYYNIKNVIKIVNYIRHFSKKTFIFLGGFLPTLDYVNVINSGIKIDCCIIGGGEETSLEIVKCINSGKDWKVINNIAYKNGDNNVIKTHQIPPSKNLDVYPFPYRCQSNRQFQFVSVLSSRGCYGDCSFCGEKEFANSNCTKGISYRSVENVLDEIKLLKKHYKFESLRFNDSNFLDASSFRKQWLLEFSSKLIYEQIKIKFSCNARSNDIVAHEQILKSLKDAGLEAVFIGIESFVNRQLKLYSKHINASINLKSMEILKRNGIKLEAGFIFIEPFVSLEEFIENINILLNSCFFDIVDITQSFISGACTLISIPGTRINKKIEDAQMKAFNQVGYFFEDNKVDLLYKIITKWNKIIDKFTIIKRFFYRAKVENSVKLEEKFLNQYRTILKADVVFMKFVALDIQNGIVNDDNYMDYIIKYSSTLFDEYGGFLVE